MDYLEDQFSQTNSNIRAITSNGSEMDTIVFRAEEFSPDSVSPFFLKITRTFLNAR